MLDRVEPFYKKHACDKLVMDEYRKRAFANKSKRLCRSMKKMYCTTFDQYEIELHEYKDNTNEFSHIQTIESGIEVKNVIYNCDKLYIFGHEREVSDSIQYSYFVVHTNPYLYENKPIKILQALSFDFITSEMGNLPELPFNISKPLVVAGKYIYVFGQPNQDDGIDFARCARYFSRRVDCFNSVFDLIISDPIFFLVSMLIENCGKLLSRCPINYCVIRQSNQTG